ncbi:MAG: cytochrome C oxidase subunit IV family protein [Candidatus Binatia bacterium]
MELAHKEPNYMAIFYWLAGLTAAELAVAYMPLLRAVMIAGLISLAISKAALVAMYFMHLRFEHRTLGMIALVPPALLIMFLALTYPDAAWRYFVQP